MVDRIRWDAVSYLPFYYIFFEIDFQFLLLTIFNLQAKILAIKDILSNLIDVREISQFFTRIFNSDTIIFVTLNLLKYIYYSTLFFFYPLRQEQINFKLVNKISLLMHTSIQ